MLQVGQGTYRVIDASFRLDGKSRLKNTLRYFCGMHEIVLTRMRTRRKDRSGTSGVGTIKSLLVPNCLILSMSFMDSVVIL